MWLLERRARRLSRSTGADRSCRSDQPERYGSGRQVAVAVECLDVLVGGTARQPPSEPQNDCGGSEPDKRKPRLHPPVEVTGTIEQDIDDDPLPQRHSDPRQRAGHGREHDGLARPARQVAQLLPSMRGNHVNCVHTTIVGNQ